MIIYIRSDTDAILYNNSNIVKLLVFVKYSNFHDIGWGNVF